MCRITFRLVVGLQNFRGVVAVICVATAWHRVRIAQWSKVAGLRAEIVAVSSISFCCYVLTELLTWTAMTLRRPTFALFFVLHMDTIYRERDHIRVFQPVTDPRVLLFDIGVFWFLPHTGTALPRILLTLHQRWLHIWMTWGYHNTQCTIQFITLCVNTTCTNYNGGKGNSPYMDFKRKKLWFFWFDFVCFFTYWPAFINWGNQIIFMIIIIIHSINKLYIPCWLQSKRKRNVFL